jgi:hypothetical protein
MEGTRHEFSGTSLSDKIQITSYMMLNLPFRCFTFVKWLLGVRLFTLHECLWSPSTGIKLLTDVAYNDVRIYFVVDGFKARQGDTESSIGIGVIEVMFQAEGYTELYYLCPFQSLKMRPSVIFGSPSHLCLYSPGRYSLSSSISTLSTSGNQPYFRATS